MLIPITRPILKQRNSEGWKDADRPYSSSSSISGGWMAVLVCQWAATLMLRCRVKRTLVTLLLLWAHVAARAETPLPALPRST